MKNFRISSLPFSLSLDQAMHQINNKFFLHNPKSDPINKTNLAKL